MSSEKGAPFIPLRERSGNVHTDGFVDDGEPQHGEANRKSLIRSLHNPTHGTHREWYGLPRELPEEVRDNHER